MAIKEVRREWDECQLDYVKEFALHNEADVANLPKCCIGSTAIVAATNNVYVCGKGQEWKLREEAIEEGPGAADVGVSREEFDALSEEMAALDVNKVSLPASEEGVDAGTAGQFAVSDGKGGIAWKTLVEVEGVSY